MQPSWLRISDAFLLLPTPFPKTPFGRYRTKVGKWPVRDGKQPIKANGLFSGTPPLWNTAYLKRPITSEVYELSSETPRSRYRRIQGQYRLWLALSHLEVTIRPSRITQLIPQEFSGVTKVQRIAKGAGKKVPRENCRKVSKNFLTLFDDF